MIMSVTIKIGGGIMSIAIGSKTIKRKINGNVKPSKKTWLNLRIIKTEEFVVIRTKGQRITFNIINNWFGLKVGKQAWKPLMYREGVWYGIQDEPCLTDEIKDPVYKCMCETILENRYVIELCYKRRNNTLGLFASENEESGHRQVLAQC